jgi:hypothetical protein
MIAIDNDSLAELLDVVRQKIMDHWDRGQNPMYVALHPDLFRAVMDCKANKAQKGYAVLIMGLEVTCADQVPLGNAEIY